MGNDCWRSLVCSTRTWGHESEELLQSHMWNRRMSSKEPRTFHDAVKPIIYFNCFMGMGAYRQPDTSNTLFFFMQLYVIVIIILNWTMVYISSADTSGDKYYKDTPAAARAMYGVLVSTNSVIAATSPFLLGLQKKGLTDCLQQMPILDDTFQDIIGARNHSREQYIRLTRRVIGIVLVMALVSICDTPWILSGSGSLSEIIVCSFNLHYPVIVILVLDLNFCSFVRYLRTKFQDLNDGLLKMAKKSPAAYDSKKVSVISRRVLAVEPGLQMKDTKAEGLLNDNLHLLHEIRKIYLELCKLSRKINLVFGIQNLLSMGISFTMVTGLLYTIYSAFAWQRFPIMQIVPTVLWTIIYISKIWIVNHLCWSLGTEADRTGDVIYELLEIRVDKELQKEIQEFAVQILQNPIRFNACGFFTLDYAFVQGVIASITTYLVILIQMSPVPKSPIFDTALAWNHTEVSPN